MRLSELIRSLQVVAKANGTFDPLVRIIGRELDRDITGVGTLEGCAVIQANNDEYVPCVNCGLESNRFCGCDK